MTKPAAWRLVPVPGTESTYEGRTVSAKSTNRNANKKESDPHHIDLRIYAQRGC
jgi:hypothetical protein